jgi:hypothetical protein
MYENNQKCPKCKNSNYIRYKLITIGKYQKITLAQLHPLDERVGWRKNSELTVNECDADNLKKGALSQYNFY